MNEKMNQQARDRLLDSIARARGYEYSREFGLIDLDADEVVAEDSNTMAKYLLGQMTTAKDIETFESIMTVITKFSNYESLIEHAVPYFQEHGVDLLSKPVIYETGSVAWFRNILNTIDQ